MASYQDLLAKSEAELAQEIEKAEHERLGLKMGLVADQEKDSSKMKKVKKRIAQLKTARRDKQLGISVHA